MIDGGAKPGTAEIEIAGRNWLTAQLLMRGFEVATPEVDRGVDLIVFREIGECGIRALPLQLKCASGESFSLDKKFAGRGIVMAYVWNVLLQPAAYLLTYNEARGVLSERAAAQTASWTERGRYVFNRIPRDLRERLAPFQGRWAWLGEQLDAQPRSGI